MVRMRKWRAREKQIKQLFENLFNNVNDSSFEINLDNNVKIEYKISLKKIWSFLN